MMKTNCIASKRCSLFLLNMAVIVALLTPGCEEADYVIYTRKIMNDTQESVATEPQLNEIFVVNPAGTRVTMLDGEVELYFLEGAVQTPTRFSISSFPVTDLDLEDYNLQKWGIRIESTSQENTFSNKVRIWLKYNPDQFRAGSQQSIDQLTIFRIDQHDSANTRIESIGNCSIDIPFQKIKGYINKCGYYVVGANL